MITEAVFIDNKTDMEIANSVDKQNKFGVVYAKGLLKTLGISYKEVSDPPASTNTKKMQS